MKKGLPQIAATAVALAFSLPPSSANAQTPARTFDELLGKLRSGDMVWVTDETQRETKGQIVDLTKSALVLTTDQGRQVLPAANITRVRQRRPDPLWNGVIIGSAVALAPLIWWFAAASEEGETAGDNAAFIAALIAAGAGAGAGIDALKQGRKTIYLAPGHSSARVGLSPMLSRTMKGARVSLFF